MLRSTAAPPATTLPGSSVSRLANLPFFYGWVILAIAVVATVATTPGQTHGVTIFNPFFTAELALSKTQLSGAYMVATLLAGLTMPWLGSWMDKRGIRVMMTLVVCGLSGTCLLASYISDFASLLVVFFLFRMLGQGALSLLASNAVGMWFDTRLGTANGILSVLSTLITSQVLLAMNQLVSNAGWRMTYRIIAICVAASLLPLLAFLFRNRPEDIGGYPDGRTGPVNATVGRQQTLHHMQQSFDFGEVLRTRCYWILIATHIAWSLIGTALIFHIHGLFEARELDTTAANQTLTQLFIAAAAVQLISGILADRVPLHLLLATSSGGMLVATGMLLSANPSLLGAGYLVFGMSQAITGVVSGTIFIRYFGRNHIGKIRGSVFSAMVAGSAIGPFVMGFLYEQLGSFNPSLWLFAGIFLVVTILTMRATPPKPDPAIAP